jgi:hypothetical protein
MIPKITYQLQFNIPNLLWDLELDSIYSQAEKMVSKLSAASPQELGSR